MKETNYPFPSNELYMFFGFNRHNNFIRILKNDKYSSEITIKPWSKINYRSSIVYYVTRNLFYILCQKYIKDYTAITDVYFEYKQSSLKSKILRGLFISCTYIFYLLKLLNKNLLITFK